MLERGSVAETTVLWGPITGPMQDVAEWKDVVQPGYSSAGGSLQTERQPAGALILADGAAVVEIVPPVAAPEEVRGAFDYSPVDSPPQDDLQVVTRYRIGPGDHLEVAGGARHVDGRVAVVHAGGDCVWSFVPLAPPGGGAVALDAWGRHPVVGALADARLLERQGLVERLTRFPLLSNLSFDAVRYIASFFRVGRYGPGDKLFKGGERVRPTLVLAGRVAGPSGSHGPGSVLFQDDLTHDVASLPSIASADYVTEARMMTAELPAGLAGLLVAHDHRAMMGADGRREWPWVVVMGGGAEETAPDAQTIALNLAAREGTDLQPASGLDVATPVLVIDADYESLELRAPSSLLSEIVFDPDWSTWSGPGRPFGSKTETGVVGLDYKAFTEPAEVQKLIGRVDKWFKGQDVYKKIYFRLPRGAGLTWRPVLRRAFRIQVTTDDLLDPLPPFIPPLADVLRIVRPIPDQPFRMVSRVPYFTLPRTPEPTADFWQAGEPWFKTQE